MWILGTDAQETFLVFKHLRRCRPCKSDLSKGRIEMTSNSSVKALDRGANPLFELFLVFLVISSAILYQLTGPDPSYFPKHTGE